MDARVRERQIERAWIAHDPSRAKIPQDAWRALRNFKKQITPQAARVGLDSNARERIKANRSRAFPRDSDAAQRPHAPGSVWRPQFDCRGGMAQTP
jgi:hypothetical protein